MKEKQKGKGTRLEIRDGEVLWIGKMYIKGESTLSVTLKK